MTALLNTELQRFQLAPVFTEAEVAHALLPVHDVVASYVVEDDGAPPPPPPGPHARPLRLALWPFTALLSVPLQALS